MLAKKISAGLITGMFALTAHAALLIDDFSVDTAEVSDGTGAGDYAKTCGLGASSISDCRELYVQRIGGAGGPSQSVNANVSSGVLNINSDSRNEGYAIVKWDGTPADNDITTNTFGLGNIDFAGLASGLTIGVLFSDPGQGTIDTPTQDADKIYITFQAYTSAAQFSTVTFEAEDHTSLYNLSFTWAEFLAAAALQGGNVGGGVNFGAVNMIQALVNWGDDQQAFDITIDFVSERVPEPATLALLGLGLVGLGLGRSKKAK